MARNRDNVNKVVVGLISAAQKTADGKITAEYGSYTGDGNASKRIDVTSGMPIAIAIIGTGNSFVASKAASYVSGFFGDYSRYYSNQVSFGSRSVTLTKTDDAYANYGYNKSSGAYRYIIWCK